jgi:hypothetical protein
MQNIAWLIFIASALLEVGGDAVVRKGLRGGPIIQFGKILWPENRKAVDRSRGPER